MDALTLFGLFAVSAMLLCYALDRAVRPGRRRGAAWLDEVRHAARDQIADLAALFAAAAAIEAFLRPAVIPEPALSA
jgi:uncharacterized membrane protein SpoIIM required for sporulation